MLSYTKFCRYLKFYFYSILITLFIIIIYIIYNIKINIIFSFNLKDILLALIIIFIYKISFLKIIEKIQIIIYSKITYIFFLISICLKNINIIIIYLISFLEEIVFRLIPCFWGTKLFLIFSIIIYNLFHIYYKKYVIIISLLSLILTISYLVIDNKLIAFIVSTYIHISYNNAILRKKFIK